MNHGGDSGQTAELTNLSSRLENAPSESPLLEIVDLTIDFTSPDSGVFRAVESVSFSVQPFEKVIVLGPSGCGKSTVLKAIGGFNHVSSGQIVLEGAPVLSPGPDRFLVFQDTNQLFPWRTVLGNVADACEVVLDLTRGEARTRASEYLELVGLSQFESFFPHTLSGGMKQRAAIARALSVDPKLLLMDEPFGALDAQTRTRLQAELNDIWIKTKTTIIFVTHSIDEAVRLGTRIIIMGKNPGHIKADMVNPFSNVFAHDIEAEPSGAGELRSEIRRLLH